MQVAVSAAANDRSAVTELDELLLSPDNKVSHLCFNTHIAQSVALMNIVTKQILGTEKIA
jgi:hypothetical protein